MPQEVYGTHEHTNYFLLPEFRGWKLFVNVRVPFFCIGLIVITMLTNVRPPENLLRLAGAGLGVLYPQIVRSFERRGVPRASAPVNEERFRQIDID